VDALPHLFEPFFRAAHMTKGTGLELTITKEIVELHNDHI
jgi:signal transduction histidine kinase